MNVDKAMKILKAIGATAFIMILLDAGWLSLRNSYHQRLFQDIQGSALTVRILPALLIYMLLPSAIYLGAVRNASDLRDAIQKSALVGFIMYAFYDLTNYATLRGWTLTMTIIDILWGTVLCTVGGAVGYFMYH
jgi:uncharacterized membrane protein